MSKEVIVVENNDVVVYEDKTAFISRNKVCELLGVRNKSTLDMVLKRNSGHLEPTLDKGLSPKNLFFVATYFAFKSREKLPQAEKVHDVLGVAGATAYLYTLAGYQLNAEPPKPKSQKLLGKQPKLSPGQYYNPDNSHKPTTGLTTVLGFCDNNKQKAHELFLKLVAAEELNVNYKIEKVAEYSLIEGEEADYKRQAVTGSILFEHEWLEEFVQSH